MVKSEMRSLLAVTILAFAFVSALSSCGVRGRPQPPTTPPEIGRGQPTFRRATEPFAFSNVPPVPTPTNKPEDPARDTSKK